MMRAVSVLLLLTVMVSPCRVAAQRDSGEDVMRAHAVFTIEEWAEETFSRVEGAGKLTRVSVVKSYAGEITGEGRLEYLMQYFGDGSAEFYGLERVSGRIGDRVGTFVLCHEGTFAGGEMDQMSVVVAGSGTGDLAGLRGETSLIATHQEEYPFTLTYDLESQEEEP